MALSTAALVFIVWRSSIFWTFYAAGSTGTRFFSSSTRTRTFSE